MARLFHPDGSVAEVTPANGTAFTLEELYAILGCDIVEMRSLSSGRVMVFDEEGKLRRPLPPRNLNATLHIFDRIRRDDYVVGPALICSPAEVSSEPELMATRRVRCCLCGHLCSRETAHRHHGTWVGACCWDERLRSTE
jgi:hypothetical protein